MRGDPGLCGPQDHRAHPQEESPTLAGVGQTAPPPRAPSSYMLVELQRLLGMKMEEVLTSQMILTTRVEWAK